MKKTICLILCFCLLASFTQMASANYEDAIARVCGIGVMGNVSDGDFRGDDNITRSEFTAVALRLLGIFSCNPADTEFDDVPIEHWASGYVALATDMGLINGRGEGVFAPEDYVSYEEAAKILVCVVGRNYAMTSFDYPQSYMAAANTSGLTQGVEYTDKPLTRAEVAMLANNALGTKPLEPVYGSNRYELSSLTLFEKLSEMKDTLVFSGILTETQNLSLSYSSEREKNIIKVDGRTFKTNINCDGLVGQYVDVYYSDDAKTDTATQVVAQPGVNKLYKLDSKDTFIENNKINYTQADKEKFYQLADDAIFVLNGDRTELPDNFSVEIGDYTLIDNNAGKDIDVVMVTVAESFVVSSVNTEANGIYFDNDATYHGKNGIALDFDDENKAYVIEDKDGNALEFQSIQSGDAVSIVGNADDSRIKIIVSSQSVTGSITEMTDSSITVGSETYEIGKDSTGRALLTPYLGMEGRFVIDAFGYCIGTHGASPDKFTYCYIVDAIRSGSLDSEVKIKIVTGTEPQRNVKIKNGDETVSYYLQNNEPEVYTLASSLKYKENPVDARGEKVSCSDLDINALDGKIAGFTLDKNGEINALNVYSVPANFSSYEFNAEIFSFGGMRAARGFVKDEGTQVVCVPNVVNNEDDYGVRVQITDEANVKVYGVKGIYENTYGSDDANAEPADIIVVKADMNSDLPPTISMDDPICIIGKIGARLSDDGEEICTVELLNGQTKETYEVTADSLVYTEVKKLRKGDLVQLASNSKSEIANVRKLASVQGLSDYTDEENLYGVIEDVKYNVYDYFSNQMIDRLVVNAGSNLVNVKLYKSEGQNIYLYDRKSGFIQAAASDDIKAASYYGSNASKVFAYMTNNEAEVVVLIKD
ncbi:MAG: S-layer homology domain-containing protein [Ruminococcaceae bacterium]|nr:S-layer homology domain-containing protein [Oscillospiraceae bacterium]